MVVPTADTAQMVVPTADTAQMVVPTADTAQMADPPPHDGAATRSVAATHRRSDPAGAGSSDAAEWAPGWRDSARPCAAYEARKEWVYHFLERP
eukprot:gene3643-21313_t